MLGRIFQKFIWFLTGVTLLAIFCIRCANTQSGPSGGSKDTIPPVLLKTIPQQNAVNFTGKQISLVFDEYMALKEVQKNVVISPPSLQRPIIRRKGKSVQVLFQDDTLRSNKTYIIDFGNALRDNNEGNHFPPYRFVFSTGSLIDSMVFTGILRDAYTLEPIENATVLLHEDLRDSAVYVTMPVAVARTDAWGYFALPNIAQRDYRMFAIEDKNSNYRYDAGEKIAFLNTLVTPIMNVLELPVIESATDTAALLARPVERCLLAAKESKGKQYLSEYSQLGKRQFKLMFNQPDPTILSLKLNGLDSADYVIEHSLFKDTLTYWITTDNLPDTLRGILNYLKTDSLNNLSPTEVTLRFQYKESEKPTDSSRKKDEQEKPPTLIPKIDFNQQKGMYTGISIKFETLPIYIDTTKITLLKINAEKKTRQPETFRWEKSSLSLLSFFVNAKWATATDYELEILPDAFIDVYGLANDSIVKKITTPNPDKFCSIELALTNVQQSQYIVQILDKKKEKIICEKIIHNAGKFMFDYLPAGEYCIRFIDDENRNNIWDTGDILQKKQPEQVAFLRLSDGSDILILRENSEIEQTVDIKELFAPLLPEQKQGLLNKNVNNE